MITKVRDLALSIAVIFCLFVALPASAQERARIRGMVVDPSGAGIPGATVALATGERVQRTTSSPEGRYAFNSLSAGTYTLTVVAKGFAPLTVDDVVLAPAEAKDLKLSLAIAVQQEHVTVNDDTQNVGLSPDQNSSALVIRGSDLDALSDDPDELQNELQALAGPAAGPNGGQIFIDGFEGGQIPPKSSILEIRVNQNPFSAEFDRIGYGRIEIITKPGSQKFQGSAAVFATASPLNTSNPLVSQTPFYDFYATFGNVSGPLGKKAAYFLNIFAFNRHTQSIIDALNPANPATNFTEAFANPSSVLQISPRIDFQLGPHNITIRDGFFRSVASGSGVGTLNLPTQATSSNDKENSLQIGDTIVINPSLVNETHFQWRRIRNDLAPAYFTPAVTVQGAFTEGGASSGVVQDHQDDFELQNYSTATVGRHVLRFGTRLRAERDANFSTSGTNGTYTFSTLGAFESPTPTPTLYSQTVVSNPLARAILFDGALFVQDDWRARKDLLLGLGLRFEGQNWISDHADWAPRLAFAWSPGFQGKGRAKTVVRGGYGWFYNRFTVPNSFQSASGTPYVIQTIHDNGINQKSYVVQNPQFFNPNAPEPESVLASAGTTVPSYHTIDPHFHAALDMQGGIGVDRQITKALTGNITYLYTQGVHQYLTDNVTAPDFDPATYTLNGPPPAAYNYQFQSGGFYRQQQLIVTAKAHFKRLSFDSNYTLNYANSDTQGVTSAPMAEQDPGLDYGRASFGIRNRLFLLLTYNAPGGVIFAPLLAAQSGTPYNFTIGNDLTENNQFNARPAYGTCGDPGVVSTPFGCLDTDPVGKGEKIIPYNLGTGPANVILHIRASKTIGVGPHIKQEGDLAGQNVNNSVSGRGLSGNGGGVKLDEKIPRKFNITFVAIALNVFNIVNWAPPNAVMESPLFGKTQSLASGPYSGPTPGNRTILFFSNFTF